MTVVIALPGDMRRVTELIAAHPEWHTAAHCGEGGTIVIEVIP